MKITAFTTVVALLAAPVMSGMTLRDGDNNNNHFRSASDEESAVSVLKRALSNANNYDAGIRPHCYKGEVLVDTDPVTSGMPGTLYKFDVAACRLNEVDEAGVCSNANEDCAAMTWLITVFRDARTGAVKVKSIIDLW